MGKLPSMPVYVGDWMKDPELRRCHPSARGIWIDVMCLMWEAETRGILRKNGSSWTIKDVSDAIQGCAPRMVRELIEKGVMAVSKRKGTFYSKRMVRDELNRRRQARHGHRGGNPTLKGGVKGGVKGSLKAGGEPGAPSSSSSSSSDLRNVTDAELMENGDRTDIGFWAQVTNGYEKMVGYGASTEISRRYREFGAPRELVSDAIIAARLNDVKNPTAKCCSVLAHGMAALNAQEASDG